MTDVEEARRDMEEAAEEFGAALFDLIGTLAGGRAPAIVVGQAEVDEANAGLANETVRSMGFEDVEDLTSTLNGEAVAEHVRECETCREAFGPMPADTATTTTKALRSLDGRPEDMTGEGLAWILYQYDAARVGARRALLTTMLEDDEAPTLGTLAEVLAKGETVVAEEIVKSFSEADVDVPMAAVRVLILEARAMLSLARNVRGLMQDGMGTKDGEA